MADSESDDDLKRAIALSLQEDRPGSASKDSEVVNLVSDDEEDDDDLDAPFTAKPVSRLSRPAPTEVHSGLGAKAAASQDPAVPPGKIVSKATSDAERKEDAGPSGGLAGLDRKAMEEARLRRVRMQQSQASLPVNPILSRKRQASGSPPRPREQDKSYTKAKLSDSTAPPHSLAETLSWNQRQLLNAPGVQYPDGIVKKTWVYGVPRQGDDIKIEEVLQKDDLELAVLSAYQVEPEWVESKLSPHTKVVWVLQAKTDAEVCHVRLDAILTACTRS